MTDKPSKIDPKGANVKAYGTWVLIRFDSKPKESEGLHGKPILLPTSQQVEPAFATCVSVGHLVKANVRKGDRLIVAAHMNGAKLEGTDCHWLDEKHVYAVVE